MLVATSVPDVICHRCVDLDGPDLSLLDCDWVKPAVLADALVVWAEYLAMDTSVDWPLGLAYARTVKASVLYEVLDHYGPARRARELTHPNEADSLEGIGIGLRFQELFDQIEQAAPDWEAAYDSMRDFRMYDWDSLVLVETREDWLWAVAESGLTDWVVNPLGWMAPAEVSFAFDCWLRERSLGYPQLGPEIE